MTYEELLAYKKRIAKLVTLPLINSHAYKLVTGNPDYSDLIDIKHGYYDLPTELPTGELTRVTTYTIFIGTKHVTEKTIAFTKEDTDTQLLTKLSEALDLLGELCMQVNSKLQHSSKLVKVTLEPNQSIEVYNSDKELVYSNDITEDCLPPALDGDRFLWG